MNEKLTEEALAELNGFISSLMGLYFTPTRMGDLERGINSAAKDFGFESAARFIEWLKSRPLAKEHIERLASHLTIGETYFFRDSGAFEVLETKIVPELISARRDSRRIRVWSAGCSTGEEAYSMAILLTRLIPDIKNWNVSILATDINPRSLKKASDGVYTDWSFRDTPAWLRDKHFRRQKAGGWKIDPEIKKLVSFAYLNLAEDIYPSLLNGTNGVDMIFCRNVIMYFSEAVARSVVKGLRNSLVDDGWFLISPAEALRAIQGLFAPVNIDGSIFYRKSDKAHEAQRPVPESPLPQAFSLPPLPRIEKEPAQPKPRVEKPKPAPVSAPPVAPGVLAEAENLYGQGLYHKAAIILESLRYEDRTEPETLLLARVYANLGRLDEASKMCESVQSANTLNGAAYILLATIRQEQARAEEAINNLKKAIYLDQDFVIAHFMLGKLLLSRASGSVQARRHLNTAYSLLGTKREDELLPESDGLMAGRLKEILASMLEIGTDV